MSQEVVRGLLLAAGAGRRMGMPKGLLRDARDVPFVDRAVGALLDGGADAVTVVVGAAADQVTAVLAEAGWVEDPAVDVVRAADWSDGMGASLRAGLAHASHGAASCALVSLVDLPDVGSSVVARVLREAGTTPASLGRATYGGVPGHPVLIGSAHWDGVIASARGDRGARDYLAGHPPVEVECGDLATGRDVDRPAHL
jgi:CTP:molybdopterin cytidylyltransferase MocA